MTYTLFLGDARYSSWSLRGWLMCDSFGLPHEDIFVGLYSGTMAEDLASVAPARTVPAMRTADGQVLTDSLAMAETLAERHPGAGLWPQDPAARALARSMVAEMHSGFAALRAACPMDLRRRIDGFVPDDAVRRDLDRIAALWALARGSYGAAGDWLFGDWSLADVFYLPVAARIVTYDLPVPADARAWVGRAMAHPSFLRWRAMGLAEATDPDPYNVGSTRLPWPDQSFH